MFNFIFSKYTFFLIYYILSIKVNNLAKSRIAFFYVVNNCYFCKRKKRLHYEKNH